MRNYMKPQKRLISLKNIIKKHKITKEKPRRAQ